MKDLNTISSAEGTLRAIPSYDPALFVNREAEIDLVWKTVRALSLGESVRLRMILFWGYKGSGRTWLLRHIAEILKKAPDVTSLYLDLDTWAVQPAKEATQALFVQLAEYIWGSDSEQASLYKRATYAWPAMTTSWLRDDIDSLLQKQVLVLLLDHVYESDRRLLEILEERLLAPLAIQSRVLVVMAGRGQAFLWKTPELRLYTKDYHLKPFNEELTQEQLQRQKPEAVSRTAQIYTVSQGYPLANVLLAARETTAQAMQETVNGLLHDVQDEERSWLEALCVLRTFDEDHIPQLLAAYFEDESIAEWPYQEIRQARDRLLRTFMVRWDEEAGGWEVDRAIRPMLDRYLQETKLEVWRRLHCAAYQLYQIQKQQYPDEKERWQAEADYHAGRLREVGYNPEACP